VFSVGRSADPVATRRRLASATWPRWHDDCVSAEKKLGRACKSALVSRWHFNASTTPMLLALSITIRVRPTWCAPTISSRIRPCPSRLRDCSELVQPPRLTAGRFVLSTDALVKRQRCSDVVAPWAMQTRWRCCRTRRCSTCWQPVLRTDRLSEIALAALWRRADRLGSRAGHLRLRAPAHRVRYAHACPRAPHWRLQRAAAACAVTMRTWRLRCAVHEHPHATAPLSW